MTNNKKGKGTYHKVSSASSRKRKKSSSSSTIQTVSNSIKRFEEKLELFDDVSGDIDSTFPYEFYVSVKLPIDITNNPNKDILENKALLFAMKKIIEENPAGTSITDLSENFDIDIDYLIYEHGVFADFSFHRKEISLDETIKGIDVEADVYLSEDYVPYTITIQSLKPIDSLEYISSSPYRDGYLYTYEDKIDTAFSGGDSGEEALYELIDDYIRRYKEKDIKFIRIS